MRKDIFKFGNGTEKKSSKLGYLHSKDTFFDSNVISVFHIIINHIFHYLKNIEISYLFSYLIYSFTKGISLKTEARPVENKT